MILWQMTESISTGKLSSAKIPQAQGAQSMRGRQQPQRWLCAHSEPHKSSQARTAPLTLTQKWARRRRAGRLGVGGRKKEKEKKCMSLSPFWSAVASTYTSWWRAQITLFLWRQIWHVFKGKKQTGKETGRGIEGERWGDGKTILLQMWSLKHPWVEEWMLKAAHNF